PRPADYKSAALPTELHQHIQVTHLTLVYNTTSEHFCQHFFKIFSKKFIFRFWQYSIPLATKFIAAFPQKAGTADAAPAPGFFAVYL
ncbi:MAG: hypothetical protein ACI4FO_03065, partial [Acutalibacteraceae bacterium]